MRSRVAVGVLLFAAGVAAAVLASRWARDVPPPAARPAFRAGLHCFAPPPPAEPTPAAGTPGAPLSADRDAAAAPQAARPERASTPAAGAEGEAATPGPAAPDPTAPADVAPVPAAPDPVPADPAAPGTAPSTGAAVQNFEAHLGPLQADDVAAVCRALEPLAPSAVLPLRLMVSVPPEPRGLLVPPRAAAVAIVADADADRLLAPLVVQPAVSAAAAPGGAVPAAASAAARAARPDAGGPAADVYFGPGASADARADDPLAVALAGSAAARLDPSARCFADMILVRRSAAGRLGLEPAAETPNLLVAAIDAPGRIEEAMVLARPLWPDRRIAVRPVDWALDPAGGPRRLGLAALALILAGGALVVATVLPALGRLGEDARAPASWVADGARLLGGRSDYGVVVAAMMAALAAGAAWGGPPGAGDLARELVAEPMARVGLESAAPEAGQLLGFFVTAMMTNVLLWGLVAIGAAGLVPGLGLALALGQMLAWGVTLAPDTLTLLDRLPLRAAVAVVEAGGYALLALGSWRVLVGTVRPQALGQERVRQGYGAGLSHLYRLIAPAVALVVVAAALETILLAVVGHWR